MAVNVTPLAVIADVAATPVTYFVHADHLDRPIKLTDAARASVWDATYRPFGEVHAITGTQSLDARYLGLTDRGGHHYNPRSLWKNEPLSPETRKVFDRATTGPVPGGHNYGEGHPAYTKAVGRLYETWKSQNSIVCEKMTPTQAQDFIRRILRSHDPDIRTFNDRIHRRIINNVLRGRGE